MQTTFETETVIVRVKTSPKGERIVIKGSGTKHDRSYGRGSKSRGDAHYGPKPPTTYKGKGRTNVGDPAHSRGK